MKLPQRNASLLVVFNYCAMALFWGSFPIAAKIGVEHAPPLLLSGVRFSLAFAIMAPLAIMQHNKLSISRKQHLNVFLISLLMVAIPSSIFFISAQFAPVGVLTIMWSVTPIFTALFTMRESGEVHGWKLIFSLTLGLTGALIVLLGHIPFLPGATASDQLLSGNRTAFIAELAVLGSAAIYGFGIRMAKHSSPEMPVMVLTTWQLFYCGLFLLVMTLVFERGYVFHPTLSTFGALFYLTIFCSCISFFLMFWLIRRIGAIRTAYADFIIPGITLVLSYFILGESLTSTKIIGMAFVITGVILVEIP
jgi:drug/metabolite transporter (DMT)-like permease